MHTLRQYSQYAYAHKHAEQRAVQLHAFPAHWVQCGPSGTMQRTRQPIMTDAAMLRDPTVITNGEQPIGYHIRTLLDTCRICMAFRQCVFDDAASVSSVLQSFLGKGRKRKVVLQCVSGCEASSCIYHRSLSRSVGT